jgi:arylsulfatase A-like enzyme
MLMPFALGLMLGACAQDQRPQRLVLLTLDTLRVDRLTQGHMPVLSDLAKRGLVFERAYAASNATQPTHASLFTSLHPWEHGRVGKKGG